MGIRSLTLNILLLIASTVGTIVVAELICRFLFSSIETRATIMSKAMVGHQEVNQYDPLLGMNGIPNLKRNTFGSARPESLTHNQYGERYTESETNQEATERIVFLGDSNAWGYGVADSETTPQKIYTLVSQKKSFQIHNLGITGFGNDQSLLKLIRDGLRHNPTTIILNYFDSNDHGENVSRISCNVEKPFFQMKGKSLCLYNVPVPVAKGWYNHQFATFFENSNSPLIHGLLKHSALVRIILNREIRPWIVELQGKVSTRLFGSRQSRNYIEKYLSCGKEEIFHPERSPHASQMTKRLIDEIAAIAQEHSAKFLVTLTPTVANYMDGKLDDRYIRLREGLERSKIPFIDIFERAKNEGISCEKLFGSNDHHLTAFGHQWEARQIIKYFNWD